MATQISTGIWMRQFRSEDGLLRGEVSLARDCIDNAQYYGAYPLRWVYFLSFWCVLGILESEDSATCKTDQMSRRLTSISSGEGGVRQHIPHRMCPEGRDARVGFVHKARNTSPR